MAEITGIAWTRSTFNPWIGCTKVGPGCDGCYAEALDKRMKFGGATHWGASVPRYRTSASNWAKPLAWNKAAPESTFAGRKGFWPVFCASLGDVFDNEVLAQWRYDLWELIDNTPNLSWLIVTKRIGNVSGMVPPQWFAPWKFPKNVRILITVVNREEAERDIPKLLALPCKNGLSIEPQLGPIDLRTVVMPDGDSLGLGLFNHGEGRGIEWVIEGGESAQPGHKARPFNIKWARDTIAQCKAAGVPVFFKQAGSEPYDSNAQQFPVDTLFIKDRAGAEPAEWPEYLRVREWPT